MHREIAAVVLCCLLLSPSAWGEDSLSDVRSEARTPRQSSSSSRKPRHHSHDHCDDDDDDDDDFFSQAIGKLLFAAVSSPFVLPHVALEEDLTGEAVMSPFPYAESNPGYLTFETISEDPWAVRAASDFGTDFSGMDRFGGQFLIEHTSRFGLDAEFNRYLEDTAGGRDSLWTGDANAVVRFAQNEHVVFHSGIGVSWLDDRFGTELGFNFTYGFTAFPKKPFTFETSMDLGTLGKAGRFHLRSTAGVNWKALEVFTGYDYQSIGGADLHGPLLGLRVWF